MIQFEVRSDWRTLTKGEERAYTPIVFSDGFTWGQFLLFQNYEIFVD